MFRGRHDHTIDKKGRLSIPAAYRNEFSRRSEKPPMLAMYKDYLALYPYEDWEVIEKDLMSKPQMNPVVQELVRFMLSGTAECPIDSQGRILVPPSHREHAQLRSKVTVAGVGTVVEIWDTEMFDANRMLTRSNLPEVQTEVQSMPSGSSV